MRNKLAAGIDASRVAWALLAAAAPASCQKLAGFDEFHGSTNRVVAQGGDSSRGGSGAGGKSGLGGAEASGGRATGGLGASSQGGTSGAAMGNAGTSGALSDAGASGTSDAGAGGALSNAGAGGALSNAGAGGALSNAGAGGALSNAGGGGLSNAGASGGGGIGGALAGAPNAIQDWSAAFVAVYRFEGFGADIGKDSSGHGHDLSIVGTPVHALDHMEGSYSVALADDPPTSNYFTSADPAFETPQGTSFTVGTWLRTSLTTGGFSWMVRGSDGFSLDMSLDYQGFRCSVSSETGTSSSTRTGLGLGFSAWTHLVCRYDDARKQLLLFVNGVAQDPADDASTGIADGAGPLVLGQFSGQLDEVFFTHALLDNYQVARIWGCGIDGSGCTCSNANPNVYATCGRFSGSCDAAPFSPCSAAPPQ